MSLRGWSFAFLAGSVAIPAAALLLSRQGIIATYEREGYVAGMGVMGVFVLVVGLSVTLLILGLVLNLASAWKLRSPRPSGRKLEFITFLSVAAAWYFLWPYVYVWLIAKP